ncbi:hypothetical protein HY408_02175 [Candidatus Gottesmanbacteria bacterium]|nr:hypothetical protein [Candidatus Gottesmanbacteria bacterium]
MKILRIILLSVFYLVLFSVLSPEEVLANNHLNCGGWTTWQFFPNHDNQYYNMNGNACGGCNESPCTPAKVIGDGGTLSWWPTIESGDDYEYEIFYDVQLFRYNDGAFSPDACRNWDTLNANPASNYITSVSGSVTVPRKDGAVPGSADIPSANFDMSGRPKDYYQVDIKVNSLRRTTDGAVFNCTGDGLIGSSYFRYDGSSGGGPNPTPDPVCPYSSTWGRSRIPPASTWPKASPTISIGDAIELGGFHNGDNSKYAKPADVNIFLTLPAASGTPFPRKKKTPPYPIVYTPNRPGVHTWYSDAKTLKDVNDTSKGYYSESQCIGTGNFKVTTKKTDTTFTNGCQQVTVNWDAVPYADEYYVYRCSTTSSGGCTPASAAPYAIVTAPTTKLIDGVSPYTPLNSSRYYDYNVKVRWDNTTSTYEFSKESTQKFDKQPVCIVSTIGVKAIEVDPILAYSCPLTQKLGSTMGTAALTLDPPAGANILLDPVGSTSYVSTPNLDGGQYNLIVTSPPPSGFIYRNACYQNVSGGSWNSGLTATLGADTLSWDVGFSLPGGWFQVRGGNVHTNKGFGISLPGSKYFLLSEEPSVNLKAGAMSYVTLQSGYSNNPNSPPYVAMQANDDEHGEVVPNHDYYSYFRSRFPNPSPISADLADDLQPTIATGLFVYEYTTIDDEYNIGGPTPWDIRGGTKIVIFASDPSSNRPLKFANGKKITVREPTETDPGGFLAFIAEGDIRIVASLGQNSPKTLDTTDRELDPDLTAWFITNKSFVTTTKNDPINEKQVIIAGTVVAQTVNLNRDLGDKNPTYPAEMFIYRPDLWINAPREFRTGIGTWREVNP